MIQKIALRLSPSDAANDNAIRRQISLSAGKKFNSITGYEILKKSIDARGKNILIKLTVNSFFDEPFHQSPPHSFHFRDIHHSDKKVIIVGAGPAGLFAALKLIESGIKPIILERGKDVKNRRRDLAILNKQGIVNPDSNYCFGEGGAGTYSDGKLYTRSNKRGDINRILQLFVRFGAPDTILYDAHPHIGTNKLPQIITAMRQLIIDCGGEIHFEKKVTDIELGNGMIRSVITSDHEKHVADAYLLATGHSARDIFELLYHKKVQIEAKPFALGVRIEHPQALIDSIQYHCINRGEFLPPASYSLVEQVNERGVFSFCMCPGGIIAPASTEPGELVVNGWSPSKRNNPFANSGMVVQVTEPDILKTGKPFQPGHPLLYMQFQKMIEQSAFREGGGHLKAPAQRMTDFCNHAISASLPGNSYLPGLQSADLHQVLPPFIYETLATGFRAFGKKMKGYFTEEAVVVATESRTSSPVRIPRNEITLQHPQYQNFYPCGEGAGYAGGIVSAAMDGERVATAITEKLIRS
jgi:uncharacterized FAD-dependent dehydrogenase